MDYARVDTPFCGKFFSLAPTSHRLKVPNYSTEQARLEDETISGEFMTSYLRNFNMKATTSHILTDKKRQSHLMLLYFISIH